MHSAGVLVLLPSIYHERFNQYCTSQVSCSKTSSDALRLRAEGCRGAVCMQTRSRTVCRTVVMLGRHCSSVAQCYACTQETKSESCEVCRNSVAWQLCLHVSFGSLHSDAQGPDACCGLCNGLHVWHREIQIYHSHKHGEFLTIALPWQAWRLSAATCISLAHVCHRGPCQRLTMPAHKSLQKPSHAAAIILYSESRHSTSWLPDHVNVPLLQMIVTVGVAIASYGELRLVVLGVILQLAAVATESTRLILVQILLQV